MRHSILLDRRSLLRGSAALALVGPLQACQTTPGGSLASWADQVSAYGGLPGEKFVVEPIDTTQLDRAFLRSEVDYPTREAPGTVVVDSRARYLYLVLPGGRARRYGVGVGSEGSAWSGTATVNSKQEWPDWYPTAEMIARKPEIEGMLSELQGGMGFAGGSANPLGARALYLWQGRKDTLYRIHGTPEPYTIGQAVSSGCIRMINQDAIDLYGRVEVGARVVVLPG